MSSSGSSGRVGWGRGTEIYAAAIFLWLIFTGSGGGMALLTSPWFRYWCHLWHSTIIIITFLQFWYNAALLIYSAYFSQKTEENEEILFCKKHEKYDISASDFPEKRQPEWLYFQTWHVNLMLLWKSVSSMTFFLIWNLRCKGTINCAIYYSFRHLLLDVGRNLPDEPNKKKSTWIIAVQNVNGG